MFCFCSIVKANAQNVYIRKPVEMIAGELYHENSVYVGGIRCLYRNTFGMSVLHELFMIPYPQVKGDMSDHRVFLDEWLSDFSCEDNKGNKITGIFKSDHEKNKLRENIEIDFNDGKIGNYIKRSDYYGTSEAKFKNGKLNGIALSSDGHGHKRQELYYKDNELIEAKEYENGEVPEEYKFQNGKLISHKKYQ